MADNFSLDDILAEIDAKKADKNGKSGDKNPKPKRDYSVTSIINGDDLNSALDSSQKTAQGSEKYDFSVSAIIGSTKSQKEDKPKKEAPKKPAHVPIAVQAEVIPQADEPKEQTNVKKNVEKASDNVQPKKKTEDNFKEKPKQRTKEKEPAEVKRKEKSGSDFLAAITRKLTDVSDDEPLQDEGKTDKKEEAKPAKRSEYNTEQRVFINRQLEAEESFENPDELIDAINPYEIKSKAEDMGAVLGGDTLGIAGNDLKQLAEASAKSRSKPKLVDKTTAIDSSKLAGTDNIAEKTYSESASPEDNTKMFSNEPTLETTAPVKQYVPQKEKENEQAKKAPPHKMTEKERRSNDALLTKLNQALSKQHEQEEEKKRTLGLSKASNVQPDSLKAPTSGLNLDDERIIMATGVIPDSEIKEKSKRKLRDFVMDSDSEDEEEVDDFESYDSTGQIWADLCESHKVIKIRLVLLFIITLFMSFVALMGDLNNGMVFDFFGYDVAFLDRRADVQGFLFYSLIVGVIAAVLCSSVISNGLIKLFKMKADCDSVCAITSVVTIIATAINIIRADDVLMSRSFILIPTAIAGLMFNTVGKLIMIRRAKRNFRFVSGDSAKYSAVLINDQTAATLTKGVISELPCLAAMRKTELLTDFLKNSYCEDKADKISKKLVPIALGIALLVAAVSFFIPYGIDGLQNNIYRAITVFTAILTVATPFSVMFIINIPLTRAGLALAKTESVILGYEAAEDFSKVNSVMTDAALLFPAGTVIYSNIKHCKQPNSINNIALDQAIILAASLAIQSGSVMSNMFKNMINDKEDILVKVENCVYEDNLGVLGWFGTRRMIMGSRDQMKRHDIKVPEMKKVNRFAKDNTETIYLSVGGEIVIMFFVELLPNPEVKLALHELINNGISIVVKTTDSIVTVAKIAEVFDIPPEMIRILPYSMHEQYYDYTHYVSRGSGAVSCSGTFTGFSKAVASAKKLMMDISLGSWVMILGVVLGIAFAMAAAFTGNTQLLCPSIVTGWNLVWLLLSIIVEGFRRY